MRIFCRCILLISLCFLTGCNIRLVSKEEEKKDVPFVILGQEVIPKEVKELIESRKEEEIKLTYADQDKRYLIVGYGRQNQGGYSIYIQDLYETANSIVLDTALVPPKEKSKEKDVASYPVIVIQISEMALPVVFR